MSRTLAIRFPLGRYHANPWDRAANEGASEWPPSPWRILRALIATWHTRWPDLPESVIDGLLDALAEPPSYRTPHVTTGHTRHYLPDLDHRRGEPGRTDLTLDPFLAVDQNDELLVRWNADLPGEQRQALAKLVELIPYLGRSGVRCVRPGWRNVAPDETWWRPGASGSRQVRLLTATRPVSRAVLEASTAEIRRRRRTVPPGTAWISYAAGDAPQDQPPVEAAMPDRDEVTAIRFAVTGTIPLKVTHGILLAERGAPAGREDAHQGRAGRLAAAGDLRHQRGRDGSLSCPLDPRAGNGAGQPDRSVPGYLGAAGATGGKRRRPAQPAADVRAPRRPGGLVRMRGGGFPPVELLFQAAWAGSARLAPGLRGWARRWRS